MEWGGPGCNGRGCNGRGGGGRNCKFHELITHCSQVLSKGCGKKVWRQGWEGGGWVGGWKERAEQIIAQIQKHTAKTVTVTQ